MQPGMYPQGPYNPYGAYAPPPYGNPYGPYPGMMHPGMAYNPGELIIIIII